MTAKRKWGGRGEGGRAGEIERKRKRKTEKVINKNKREKVQTKNQL